MEFVDIFQAKSTKLFWNRLNDDHVVGESFGQPIKKGEAYFGLRLKEMYVANARKLWRKFYPILHAFVRYQGGDRQAIVGPGQLREFGESGLDRVVTRNQLLAGPIPY